MLKKHEIFDNRLTNGSKIYNITSAIFSSIRVLGLMDSIQDEGVMKEQDVMTCE